MKKERICAILKMTCDAVCRFIPNARIAVALLDFEAGVALGLPIIRTSVGHGTAFDIAGKGLASTVSLIRALEFAVKLRAL